MIFFLRARTKEPMESFFARRLGKFEAERRRRLRDLTERLISIVPDESLQPMQERTLMAIQQKVEAKTRDCCGKLKHSDLFGRPFLSRLALIYSLVLPLFLPA